MNWRAIISGAALTCVFATLIMVILELSNNSGTLPWLGLLMVLICAATLPGVLVGWQATRSPFLHAILAGVFGWFVGMFSGAIIATEIASRHWNGQGEAPGQGEGVIAVALWVVGNLTVPIAGLCSILTKRFLSSNPSVVPKAP